MAQSEEVEERPVEMSELQAGITLKAGHPVILLVGGLHGNPDPTGDATGGEPPVEDPSGGTTGGPTGTEPPAEDPTGDASGEATGTEPTGTEPTGEATGGEPTGGGTGTSGDPTGGEPTGGEQTGAEPPVTPSTMAVFDAAHFETDKAFPLTEALPTFRDIAAFTAKEPHRALLVAGHTDAVGGASHNQGLSEDRAAAVAAYLKNDVGPFYAFYEGAPKSKKWGTREDQHMLAALPHDSASKYLTRAPVDVVNADVKTAFRKFQKAAKIPETGAADKDTRKKLIAAYMAADGTSTPADAIITTLGCGEKNLKVNTQSASKANRRVEVFAFEKADFTPTVAEYNSDAKVYDAWLAASKPMPASGAAPAPTQEAAKDTSLTLTCSPAKGSLGDTVEIKGTTDLPDGTSVQLSLLAGQGGAQVAALTASVQGGALSAKWVVDGLTLAGSPSLNKISGLELVVDAPGAATAVTAGKFAVEEHKWVRSLYVNLLGRTPEPAGFAYWIGDAKGGKSAESIASGFFNSEELCTNRVTELYKKLLGREPDAGGLRGWVDQLKQGKPMQQIITGFLDSAEYKGKHPVPDAWVESLYVNLLGRASEAKGKSGWVGSLKSGASTASVISGFLKSPEYCTKRVTEFYRHFLGREPEQAGLQGWVNQATGGTAMQTIERGFVCSPEYFKRVNQQVWTVGAPFFR